MEKGKPITKRQLKYLNILLSQYFEHNRKLYLREFCGVESSKDLTLLEASDIIERLAPDNLDKEHIAEARHRMLEIRGQRSLID